MSATPTPGPTATLNCGFGFKDHHTQITSRLHCASFGRGLQTQPGSGPRVLLWILVDLHLKLTRGWDLPA